MMVRGVIDCLKEAEELTQIATWAGEGTAIASLEGAVEELEKAQEIISTTILALKKHLEERKEK